jgi:hypothetical protein
MRRLDSLLRAGEEISQGHSIEPNFADFRRLHSAPRLLGKDMVPSEAAMPIHPGALRYYREAVLDLGPSIKGGEPRSERKQTRLPLPLVIALSPPLQCAAPAGLRRQAADRPRDTYAP